MTKKSTQDHPKHFIYGLYCDDELFYIGYCSRPLQDRLNEHIYTALNPTYEQSVNEGVRGKIDDKRKIIQTAIDEGFKLTIKCLEERYTYEPLDEEWAIIDHRQKGHFLTNTAVGAVWQPHVLVNGELRETAKHNEISDKQTKKNIQEFRIKVRNTPKRKTPTPELVQLNQEEYDQWIDTLWMEQQHFNESQGEGAPSIDRQTLYDKNLRHLRG